MSKSRQLVSFDPQFGYKLDSKGLEFLLSLSNHSNYAILTGVGKCKIGKSFLLNQILQQNVFPTSSHLDACTKGILISEKTLQANGYTIIVLDTQGFGGLQSTNNIDSKLLMLSILISSVLIYNSIGTIDQHALNGISMVIQIAKALEKDILKDNLFPIPNLLWVLRDFSLALEDKNGFKISSNEYLENALEEQKGMSDHINHKNRIRRVIKNLFPERTCQTVVMPTQSQQQLFHSLMNPQNLRQQFITDVNRVRSKIFDLVKNSSKKLCHQPFKISNLINCLEILVNLLNTDGIPSINTFSHLILKKQISQLNIQLNQNIEQLKQSLLLKQQFDLQQANKKVQIIFNHHKKNMVQLIGEIPKEQFQRIKENTFGQIKIIYQKTHQQIQVSNLQSNINQMCQRIQGITNLQYLDSTYFKLLQTFNLKDKSQRISSIMLRIQIVYLKRKLKLSQQAIKQNQILEKQLQFANKKIKTLSQQINNYSQESHLQMKINDEQNYPIDFHLEKYHSDRKKHQNLEYKNKSNTSFYIPYVIITYSNLIEIDIVKTLIKQDSKLNNYVEYVLEINFLTFTWNLNRKYKDFMELQNILEIMFPNEKLPSCQTTISKVLSQMNYQSKQKVQQRRKQLKDYLSKLNELEKVRNSRIFQKFIKLNKEYKNKL